ncbi:MAG: UDP-2,4-diacetamido-2,4,6-trideoxy-beta-L-altropyranose hydrolase, partial [Pseudomonadota bacterium]
IAVLDDLPGRPHDCDLLVDQTFERDQEDYAGIVPRHTMLLTGSDHALLRAPFARLRSASLARRQAGRVDRILVALGLTDVGGITRLVVAALLDGLRGRDLGIDVVIGGRAESRRFLETLADEEPSVTLHIDTNDMPRLIAEADIVIGAGGTTSWERCCLGAPTLLLVLADNQEDVARRLSLTGAATPFRPDALTDLVGELDALSRRPDRVQEMSKAASVICDGLGVGHVADWLEASSDAEPPTSLRARRADPDDRADVWIWRSDTQTLAHSLSAEQVPWEDHCRWWANALSDADRTLLMIGDADREIGHVRLDRLKDGALRVSVTLSPAYRGKGLGAQVLRTGLATLPTGAVAVAEIHRDNGASRRIFERCGFRRTGSDGPFDLYRATGGQQT